MAKNPFFDPAANGLSELGDGKKKKPKKGPKDRAGNTPERARYLGALSTDVVISDFVGEQDPLDYYKFVVPKKSDVTISLTGLKGDADIILGDEELFRIDSSARGDALDERISRLAADDKALDPGTYYLLVTNYTDENTGIASNTSYVLSFIVDPV